MNDPIAERLAYLRAKKGLTQRELAAKVGVSWSQISKYESGKSKPRYKIRWLLEQALDCPGELSADREERIANTVNTELWSWMKQSAENANMSMDNYNEFFVTQLTLQALDEILGLGAPLLFSKEHISKIQSRISPEELKSRRETRSTDISKGSFEITEALNLRKSSPDTKSEPLQNVEEQSNHSTRLRKAKI